MESSTFFVFRFVSEKSEIPPHARNLPRTSVTRQFLGTYNGPIIINLNHVWGQVLASTAVRTRGFCARALSCARPPTEARRPETPELKPTPKQQQRQR